jgi:hippurate hydrolase
MIEARMRERAELIARAFGAGVKFDYLRRYPATINTAAEAETARVTAAETAAQSAVLTDLAPSMASEDFSYMLQERPGAYIWIGNGPADGGRNLHNPNYDFNDEILPLGVEYWVRLAHRALAA